MRLYLASSVALVVCILGVDSVMAATVDKNMEDSRTTLYSREAAEVELPPVHPAAENPTGKKEFMRAREDSMPQDISSLEDIKKVFDVLRKILDEIDEHSPINTRHNPDEPFDIQIPRKETLGNIVPVWVGDENLEGGISLTSKEFSEVQTRFAKFLYVQETDGKGEAESEEEMHGVLLDPSFKFLVRKDSIERIPEDADVIVDYAGDPHRLLLSVGDKKYAVSLESKLEVIKLLRDVFKAENFGFILSEEGIMHGKVPIVIKISRSPKEELNLRYAETSQYAGGSNPEAFSPPLEKIKLDVRENILTFESPKTGEEETITLPTAVLREKLPLAFIFWCMITSNAINFITEVGPSSS